MEKDLDAFVTKELGRSMRFFLNLSCVLVVSFSAFVICVPRPMTPESVIIAFIPVIVAILFFLVFLRLLKSLENDASQQSNIELTSRVMWEFNKSWIIRSALGKIQTFIEERKEEKR